MPPAIALISHRQRFEIVGITIGRFSLGPAFNPCVISIFHGHW